MIEVVGVRFKKAGKIYYFDPSNIEINKGEYVIVETIRGIEFGEAVIAKKQINENEIVAPLKNVIRKATEEDIKKHHENKEKEKVIFYFTADGRVDFRELVKDLASIFRTRIELRQIGVRDEAKMVGGLGPCGRPMCCSIFLGDFAPVSIKMAKEQNLSLNPTKISGICGRLMCCLNYEQQTYESIRKVLPKVGSIVKTPYGQGEVVDNNVVKEEVKVKIKSEDNEEFIQPVPIMEAELISGGYEGNIESVDEEEINIEIDDADETIIKELLKDE